LLINDPFFVNFGDFERQFWKNGSCDKILKTALNLFFWKTKKKKESFFFFCVQNYLHQQEYNTKNQEKKKGIFNYLIKLENIKVKKKI
jgi:hypothetical protein